MFRIVPLFLAFFIGCPVFAQITVTDGDTLKVGKVKWRLAYIDAPELKQPYGQQAKNHLEKMLEKEITVTDLGRDYYGRRLVVLKTKTREINLALTAAGCAWAYNKKPEKYVKAQQAAERAKRGLWALPDPESPAIYRKRIKNAKNN